MRVGMRQFSEEAVEWLRAEAEAGTGRYRLAAGLCERESWFNAAGEPCVASARLALPAIAAHFGFSLPKGKPPPPSVSPPPDFPDISFEGGLAELGGVGLEPARGPAGRRAFRAMMAARHPRGDPRNPGAALLYWIRCDRLGRIGGLSFHAAGWRQRARDGRIGWDGRARRANLGLVVNNSRFLILPGVRVPHLASHALGLAVRRLAADWEAAHGRRPALACTFTGPEHAGTCYAAAGWEYAGQTSGKPPGRRAGAPPCGVWLRPLEPGWRERLRSAPEAEPRWLAGPPPALRRDAHWTELEFGFSGLADGRLRRRIAAVAREWEKRPGEPVSVVFPAGKDQKAAYRLLSNPRVRMDDILESHRAATAQRIRGESVVLAIQDTTMLDYSGLKGSTGGLATLGGGGSGSRGIPAHVTLAVSASGRALGVLGIDAGFRRGDTVRADRRRRRPDAPPGEAEGEADAPAESGEESESRRWTEGLELAQRAGRASPGARVISVCDREGDIWEMFELQAREPEAAGLLVRSCASNRRSVIAGGARRCLREHMAAQPVIGRRSVAVRARGGIAGSRGRKARKARPARTAEIELRAARVGLKAPGGSLRTLPLTAVLASETTAPPKGCEPVSWLLLSSDGEPDPQGAGTIVDRYAARWAVEEYFKTLKQGTRTEDRRLDEADDLRKCLAFDAVLAWRVFDIQRAAKAEPARPALDFLDRDELAALYIGMKDYGFTDIRAPPFGDGAFDGLTIRRAAVDIARFVGFIPSKRQELPGTEKMRKGMTYMLQATAVYRSIRNAGLLAGSAVA